MCPALDSLWMTVLGFEGMLAGPRAWILYSLSLLCLEVWQDSNWDKFSLQMDSLERRGFSHHTFNLVGNTEGRCITRQLKAADDILVEWEVYLLMWSKGSKEIHEGVKENGIKKKETEQLNDRLYLSSASILEILGWVLHLKLFVFSLSLNGFLVSQWIFYGWLCFL